MVIDIETTGIKTFQLKQHLNLSWANPLHPGPSFLTLYRNQYSHLFSESQKFSPIIPMSHRKLNCLSACSHFGSDAAPKWWDRAWLNKGSCLVLMWLFLCSNQADCQFPPLVAIQTKTQQLWLTIRSNFLPLLLCRVIVFFLIAASNYKFYQFLITVFFFKDVDIVAVLCKIVLFVFIQLSVGLLSGQIWQEARIFLMHPERHTVCNSSRLFWMRWNSVSVSKTKLVR